MSNPPASSFPGLLAYAAGEFADDLAVIDGQTDGRELTFAELAAESARVGAGLIELGVQPGDRVAVWGPNTWRWVVAALGIASAGAWITPISTRFRSLELGAVLRRSTASVLFAADRFLKDDYAALLAGAGELPDLRHVVPLEPGSPWDELGGDLDEVARRGAAVGPDEVALLLFTSGTTGLPKGAMIRGGALARTFWLASRYEQLGPADRTLAINPYFHSLGFNCGITQTLLSGAASVPFAVWDAEQALDLIERHRITFFPGPPAIFQSLLNHPQLGDRDLSSLRVSVTGAADIPDSLVDSMVSRLGFEKVFTGYGMTETSGVVSFSVPDDDPHLIATKDGKLLPGVEVKIVDGEILVRGYVVMAGYFDDAEATAATIWPDGWLSTGDIGTLDENDYVTITGRKKDMYIVGGFNAYPAEIEEVLLTHPGVGEIAIVGVPDKRLGEVGAAFVVPAAGAVFDPDDLVAWCRLRLANYKVPRYVWAIDTLPLGPSGKVQKEVLAADAARRSADVEQ